MLHQQVVPAGLQNVLQAHSSSTVSCCVEVCAVEEMLHRVVSGTELALM